MRSLAAEGRTIFVSSHILTEMAVTADHLIVIGRGRLIAESSVEDFVARSSHNFVRVRSPQVDDLARLVDTNGGASKHEDDGALAVTGLDCARIGDIAAASGITLHELASQQASLEEAFMELTHDGVDYRAATPSPAAPAAKAA